MVIRIAAPAQISFAHLRSLVARVQAKRAVFLAKEMREKPCKSAELVRCRASPRASRRSKTLINWFHGPCTVSTCPQAPKAAFLRTQVCLRSSCTSLFQKARPVKREYAERTRPQASAWLHHKHNQTERKRTGQREEDKCMARGPRVRRGPATQMTRRSATV